MALFKQRKTQTNDNTLSDRVSEGITKQEHKLAEYLNNKTSLLSTKTILFALVLFCIVIGTYCLLLITCAFN